MTTVEGLDAEVREAWGEAMCATGGSQCGFCTPGIIMRLEAGKDLLAHMCRCTGWQTINEAVQVRRGEVVLPRSDTRDLVAAQQRAAIEGRATQDVGPHVALGAGGFADDIAPANSLVAVPSVTGEWFVGETTADARRAAVHLLAHGLACPLIHRQHIIKTRVGGEIAFVLFTGSLD